MTSCFWRHKWTPWSEPIEAIKQYIWGREIETMVQIRKCERCNKQQIRGISEH